MSKGTEDRKHVEAEKAGISLLHHLCEKCDQEPQHRHQRSLPAALTEWNHRKDLGSNSSLASSVVKGSKESSSAESLRKLPTTRYSCDSEKPETSSSKVAIESNLYRRQAVRQPSTKRKKKREERQTLQNFFYCDKPIDLDPKKDRMINLEPEIGSAPGETNAAAISASKPWQDLGPEELACAESKETQRSKSHQAGLSTATSLSCLSTLSSTTATDYITVQFIRCSRAASRDEDLFDLKPEDDLENENDNCDYIEVIPALEGVTARGALEGLLEKRGLSMDSVDVFLEGSNTPLPLKASQVSAFFLGGQKVFVKVRDSPSRVSGASRSQSAGGSAGRSAQPPGTAAVETTGASKKLVNPGGITNSTSGGRKSSFAEKTEMLTKLQHYRDQSCGSTGMQGLLPSLEIEDHWSSIVMGQEKLSKKDSEQQEALWELVVTEREYICKLGMLSDVQNYLQLLQGEGFMTEIDPKSVLRNIDDVYRANLHFWLQAIHPMLRHTRDTKDPLNPCLLEPGFSEIDTWFQPYITFCLDHLQMVYYIQKKQKENELFKEFISWVQALESLRRLQLKDLLVSPMQRLTKYPLLLKAVLKNTIHVTSREALSTMIEKAEEAANRLNFEFSHRHNYDMLCRIMQCIETYDGVDPPSDEIEKLVKSHGTFCDLTAPMPYCKRKMMRRLWRRGDLKLKEGVSKIETTCYLFTDMFLVCKTVGRKGNQPRVKIVKPPYHIERIAVQALTESTGFAFLYMNEFSVPAAAYALQTATADETTRWLEFFSMAKQEYHHCREADEISMRRNQQAPCFEYLAGNYVDITERRRRRLSVGNILSDQQVMTIKMNETALPAHAANRLTTPISHRKSSSMDSTVAAAKSQSISEDRRSLNEQVLSSDESAALTDSHNRNLDANKAIENEERPSMFALGSAEIQTPSNVKIPSQPDSTSCQIMDSSHEAEPSDEFFLEPDSSKAVSGPTGNSIETLVKLLHGRSRSPSPSPKSSGGSPILSTITDAVEKERKVSLPHGYIRRSVKEAKPVFPRIRRKISEPARVPFAPKNSLSSSGYESVETLVPDDMTISVNNQSTEYEPSIDLKLPPPTSNTTSSPSPVQCLKSANRRSNRKKLEAKQLAVESMQDALDSGVDGVLDDAEATLLCGSADIEDTTSTDPFDDSSKMEEIAGLDETTSHSGMSNRRYEKRYHTADAIEAFKPKTTTYPAGILKRFSWNISNAMCSVAGVNGGKKMQRAYTASGDVYRKHSSSTMSSESFCSSSGVSSSSSQLCVNEESVAEVEAEEQSSSIQLEDTLMMGTHISSVPINQCSALVFDKTGLQPEKELLKTTLSGSSAEHQDCITPPPPLPDCPPPAFTLKSTFGSSTSIDTLSTIVCSTSGLSEAPTIETLDAPHSPLQASPRTMSEPSLPKVNFDLFEAFEKSQSCSKPDPTNDDVSERAEQHELKKIEAQELNDVPKSDLPSNSTCGWDKRMPSRAALLKLILEGELETSDV